MEAVIGAGAFFGVIVGAFLLWLFFGDHASSIASSLERIADALEKKPERKE